jgi:hypothetical protein
MDLNNVMLQFSQNNVNTNAHNLYCDLIGVSKKYDSNLVPHVHPDHFIPPLFDSRKALYRIG